MLGRFNSIFIFAFSFLALFFLNYHNLNVKAFPFTDLALDMLLADRADDGVLLYGQYSRFGFHHPGPFFFYANILFEKILMPFGYSRLFSWLIAAIFLYSIFLTIATKLFLTVIQKQKNLLYALLIALLLISLYSHILPNDAIPYLWMPSKVVLPYLIFILTLPFIAQRSYEYIPLSFLMLGICIHGYVVFPIMTLPILFLVFLYSLYKYKKPFCKQEKNYILIGLFIGVVFASPLFIDLMLNLSDITKSNLYQILSVLKQEKPSSTLSQTFDFFKQYFFLSKEPSFYILLLLSSITLFYTKDELKRYFFSLLSINLVLMLVFFSYYSTAPSPLYEFVGRYFFSVPISIVLCLFIINLTFDDKNFLKYVKIAFILLSLQFIYSNTTKPAPIRECLHIENFATKIKEFTKDEQKAKITYGYTDDGWEQAAALVLELNNQGYENCITRVDDKNKYQEKNFCKGAVANIMIVSDKNCEGNCVYKEGGYGIILPSYIISKDQNLTFKSKDLFFQNFSVVESTHRWSLGDSSSIYFKLNTDKLIGRLDLKIMTLGAQLIDVYLNDKKIKTLDINTIKTGENYSIDFNSDLLKFDAYNQLRFTYSHAHQPNSADRRILAMALKNMILH